MTLHQQKRLIFIVDDEQAVRDLIAACLKGPGLEIVGFEDIVGAIAALRRESPDLIFLDLELGNSDAIEAMRALADEHYRGALQLMSGRGMAVLESVQAAGTRYGFRFLPPISKPFRVSQVRKAVAALERLAEAAQPSTRQAPDQPSQEEPAFALDEALDREWLELWYQPKIDLRNGELAGAEGLIRARHPKRGVVLPAGFLQNASPQALVRLSDLVLTTALRDWEYFYEAGWGPLLSVNVPASALVGMPLAQIFRDGRPRSPAWPGLILEVTEDQLLKGLPLAQEIAAQLKIYNVRLSLDDFGQGYSSLARLRDLPFEVIKIDRSFVQGCASNPRKRDLCQTIVEMARRFGCTVVAEGIETEAELAAIKATGCEYGQGFLFGAAMTRDEIAAFARSRRAMTEGGDPARSQSAMEPGGSFAAPQAV
jgi:EAL domain-containing protein (putative c-di-GMP-specific phosphodiesterase class I)/CheY-like chemotaxis protein